MAEVRFARWRMPLPRSRALRMALGVSLIGGGLLAFLPVLGLWMLPLGLLVLSVDSPIVRRLRRRLEVRWGRTWPLSRLLGRAGSPAPADGSAESREAGGSPQHSAR